MRHLDNPRNPLPQAFPGSFGLPTTPPGLWALAVILLCSLAGPAHALASDKDKPVELSADSVDIDEGKGISVYNGNVDLRQGSMQLLADQVTVKHQGRNPDHITAVGKPVRFKQDTGKGTIKARARQADYEVDSEVLILTGKAFLTRAGNTMKSDRIVYDRVRHKVKGGTAAKGKERVHMTLQPGK